MTEPEDHWATHREWFDREERALAELQVREGQALCPPPAPTRVHVTCAPLWSVLTIVIEKPLDRVGAMKVLTAVGAVLQELGLPFVEPESE